MRKVRIRNKNKQKSWDDTGDGRIRHVWLTLQLAVLLVCLFLSGCTRREQLVLETGTDEAAQTDADTEEEASALPQIVEHGAEESAQESGTPAETEIPAKEQTICVHVCGAVRSPDVYELPAGSRVYEAVRQAGGFTAEADESYVNQAQVLTDGVKLVIPTIEQTQAELSAASEGEIGVTGGEETVSDKASGDGRININTATKEQLCEIPGIGATRAAAIAAYRQEHGDFAKIEDIMNVSGIKEGTYAKIKDSITVN